MSENNCRIHISASLVIKYFRLFTNHERIKTTAVPILGAA